MPNPADKDLTEQLKTARQALGLPDKASYRQVQEAYHRLSHAHHPDLSCSDDQPRATENMKRINEAYVILKRYIHSYPVPLEPDPEDAAAFDLESWWRDRFASPYGQE